MLILGRTVQNESPVCAVLRSPVSSWNAKSRFSCVVPSPTCFSASVTPATLLFVWSWAEPLQPHQQKADLGRNPNGLVLAWWAGPAQRAAGERGDNCGRWAAREPAAGWSLCCLPPRQDPGGALRHRCSVAPSPKHVVARLGDSLFLLFCDGQRRWSSHIDFCVEKRLEKNPLDKGSENH